MINIEINLNRKPSVNYINLGNQWENESETLNFTVPEKYSDYFKYVLGTKNTQNKQINVIVPLSDDSLVVSTLFTQYEGTWFLTLMCRETELDLTLEDIDISPKEGEEVFCSDTFTGYVGKGSVTNASLFNTTYKFKV